MLSIMLDNNCKKTKPSRLQTHRYSSIIKIMRNEEEREEEVVLEEAEKGRRWDGEKASGKQGAPAGAAQPPVSQH